MSTDKYSVSFQVASKAETKNLGVISHNNRDFFAKNVDQKRSGNNIIYKQIELKEFYHSLFDKALEEYNLRKRSNEKIHDYYEHIKNSKQERLFQEIIVGFGNMTENSKDTGSWEIKKQLCEEYMREFEKRNPNLKVFNAVMHLDEANPHLHIDFVPVAMAGTTKGLKTRVSFKQALIEQGFIPEGKKKNQAVMWEESERGFMTDLLHRHQLERDHKNNHRRHLTISQFKAQCEQAERLKNDLKVLSQKGKEEYSPEDITLIKNQNELMKSKIGEKQKQMQILINRNNSPIVKFEVFNSDKLLYIARELENSRIQFAEEENAIYVPEFALPQCKKLAADFQKISPGIKEKIKMDIDVLVLSSENFEQFLDKLQALGYEIKRGKYLAVKAPDAERFTRLKSLGAAYLPENLEKRIADRDKLPNAVREKAKTSTGVTQIFELEITRVITAVQGLSYRPKKANQSKIYNFDNDTVIGNLSTQLVTLDELKINSREQLYSTAEKLESEIEENRRHIRELEDEMPVLKKKISAGDNSPTLQQRSDLLPQYIDSLKSEIEGKRLKLSRVSDVIKNYEQVSDGDFLRKIICEQQEEFLREQKRSAQTTQLERTEQTLDKEKDQRKNPNKLS